MADTNNLLRQGIAAAKAGKREESRQLLMQVIEMQERNEMAWLWLASVVDDPSDQRVCLENVLDLNPNNQNAQKGLAWLDAKHPQSAAEVPAAPETHSSAPQEPETPATGATRQLSYDGSTPLAIRPKDPVPEPEPTPASSVPPELPCPYCGAATELHHERCPKCRNNLMARSATNERRSIATTILAILWFISGIPSVLGGLFYIGFTIYLSVAIRSDAARETFAADPEMAGALGLLDLGATIGVVFGLVILLLGVFYIFIGRGFLKRRPWAYVVHCVLLVLSLLTAVPVLGFSLLGTGVAAVGVASEDPGVVGSMIGLIVGILVCGVIPLALYIFLTFKSYRDFYGPKVRLIPEIEANEDADLYNAGVAFKNRGMWYMAMKAWEGAARLRPRDTNYRHALGLAYAQLNQFDQAIATLREALAITPNDIRIQESLSLVEKQAARKQ
ncbi:MAG: tetratricopeptide repeat protein [Chloroflexaceae bacterium]